MKTMQLRQVDHFARAVVAAQSVAQRRFNWLDLLLIQINWMHVFIFIVMLGLAINAYPMVVEQLRLGQGFSRQQGGIFFAPIALIVFPVCYLILPFLKWHKALLRGRIGVAEIQSIQVKERGERGIYDVRMVWIVYGVGAPFRAEYKEITETRQLWITEVKAGDRLVVLIDPTKPKVLEPVGPVDAEPRVPLPAIPELAATRTNSEDMGEAP